MTGIITASPSLRAGAGTGAGFAVTPRGSLVKALEIHTHNLGESWTYLHFSALAALLILTLYQVSVLCNRCYSVKTVNILFKQSFIVIDLLSASGQYS